MQTVPYCVVKHRESATSVYNDGYRYDREMTSAVTKNLATVS